MSEFLDAEIHRIMRENLSAAYTTDVGTFGDPSIPGSLGVVARLDSAPGETAVAALQLQTAMVEAVKRTRRERVEETLLPLAARQRGRWSDPDFIVEVAGRLQRDPEDVEAIVASEAYLFTDTFWEDFKSSRRFFEEDIIVPFAYFSEGSKQSAEEDGAIQKGRRQVVAAAARRYRPSSEEKEPGQLISNAKHEAGQREYVTARFGNGARLTLMPRGNAGNERVVKVTIDAGATNEDESSYLQRLARYRAFVDSFAERIDASSKAELKWRLDAKLVEQRYHGRFLEFEFVVESDTAMERVLSYVTEYVETAKFETDVLESLEGYFEDGYSSPRKAEGIQWNATRKLFGGMAAEELRLSEAGTRARCEAAVGRLSEGVRAGYLEATVVGDVEESVAIGAFSRTLGTLAGRAANPCEPGEGNLLEPMRGRSPRVIVLPGEREACELIVYWPLAMGAGVHEETTARALAWALQDLLEKRSEAKGVEYPSLRIDRSQLRGYDRSLSLLLSVKCERDEVKGLAEQLIQEVVDIATELDRQEAEKSLNRYRVVLARELERSSGLAVLLRFAQLEPEEIQKRFSKEAYVGSERFWTLFHQMRGKIVNEDPLALVFVGRMR